MVALGPVYKHRCELRPTAKEIAQLTTDVGNDIAGRRAIAEEREDIARVKATLTEQQAVRFDDPLWCVGLAIA